MGLWKQGPPLRPRGPSGGKLGVQRKQSVHKGEIRSGLVKANVGFMPDQFATLRQMAITNNVSFAEQVRTVLTWGLDSVDDDDEEPYGARQSAPTHRSTPR